MVYMPIFERKMNMEQLSNRKLLIAYKEAIKLNLEQEFVDIIEEEINRRLKGSETEKEIRN